MLVLEGHTAPIWSLEYSPDGRFLASRDQAGQVRVWEPASGQLSLCSVVDPNAEQAPPASPGNFYSEALAFVAADRILTADPQGRLESWNLLTNQLSEVACPLGRVYRLAASPDGKRVAFARDTTAWGQDSPAGRVCLGNLTLARASLTDWGCSRPVFCLLFSQRGDLLACGAGEWGRSGVVRLYRIGEKLSVSRWNWNHRDHAELGGPSGPVLSLAFSADDQLLAGGCSDGSVRVWRVADRQEVAHLRKHDDLVRGVAFAADGRTLISVGWDGRVKVWDVPTCSEKTTFEWHTGMIHAMAFAPDGMTAATGGQDGNIVIWDVDFA